MSTPQTSLINPLDPNKILLFHLNSKGNVALDRYRFANGKYNATVIDGYGVPAGPDIVSNPGSFTSLTTNGLVGYKAALYQSELIG
jgi:hypothetical protein